MLNLNGSCRVEDIGVSLDTIEDLEDSHCQADSVGSDSQNFELDLADASDFQVDLPKLLERNIVLLYLKLQAKHHVTDVVIQTIIEELLNVHTLLYENLRRSLRNICVQRGFSEADVNDILTETINGDVFRKCHDKETGVLRTTFCREKICLKIVP